MNSRIQQKIDIEANWAKATFAPLKGELIIYAPDENYDYPRFKIGDGVTAVNALPFASKQFATYADLNDLETNLKSYINETILGGKW